MSVSAGASRNPNHGSLPSTGAAEVTGEEGINWILFPSSLPGRSPRVPGLVTRSSNWAR